MPCLIIIFNNQNKNVIFLKKQKQERSGSFTESLLTISKMAQDYESFHQCTRNIIAPQEKVTQAWNFFLQT